MLSHTATLHIMLHHIVILTQHTLNQPPALHMAQAILLQQEQDVAVLQIFQKIFMKELTVFLNAGNATDHVKRHILLANAAPAEQKNKDLLVIIQDQVCGLALQEEHYLELHVR